MMKQTARFLLSTLAASILVPALVITASSGDVAGASTAAIAINPTYGPPLTTLKLNGSGFCQSPCSPVSVTIASLNVASGVAVNGQGRFKVFVRVPGSARPGPVTVAASQTDRSGNTVSAQSTFTVTINVPPPTRYPPPTNSPSAGAAPAATAPHTPSSASPRAQSPSLPSAPTVASSQSPASARHPGRTLFFVLLVAIVVAVVGGTMGAMLWRRPRTSSSGRR